MTPAQLLVICDDASLAYGLSYYFKEQGFSVDVVRESEAGLERCKSKSPEIVLILYSPLGPPPDDLTVCRRLRDEILGHNTPIFLISRSREEAMRAGATEWFDLVFDVADIASKVRAYLE